MSEHVRIRTLGRGAFGTAVLYRREADNTLVVVKEFQLAQASEKIRNEAIAEAEALAVLHHPNIVMVYDTYEDESLFLLEMEYADGGTLQGLIGERSPANYLKEELIKWYSFQLLSGLSHVHENGIIHRDIKAENVFLTSRSLLKLGDFGISKRLSEDGEGARTMVGTPYNMAPEVFKGQPYDERCDVFSAGTVIHELCGLKRTHQATNLLAIANRILTGKRDKVDADRYSEALCAMVEDMLTVDPETRPTTDEVLKHPWFGDTTHMGDKITKLHLSANASLSSHHSSTTSLNLLNGSSGQGFFVTKDISLHSWGAGSQLSSVSAFDSLHPPRSVAVGGAHVAVCTNDRDLYTWSIPSLEGSDGHSLGQLGLGSFKSVRQPQLVKCREFEPDEVVCGEDFSLSKTAAGALLAWGSHEDGCLGLGEDLDVLVEEGVLSEEHVDGSTVCMPVHIPFFEKKHVRLIACGANHVAAVDDSEQLYTWGIGELGRLGVGDEDDYFSPQHVELPTRQSIKSLACGEDSTVLVMSNHQLFATGSNTANKLGLNARGGLLAKRRMSRPDARIESGMARGEIVMTTVFQHVQAQALKVPIHAVALGRDHMAVIDMRGHVITVGDNTYGQLGAGFLGPQLDPVVVKGELHKHKAHMIACGDYFTVVSTKGGSLFVWGRGEHSRLAPSMDPRHVLASPQLVPLIEGVAKIAVRNAYTMVIAEKVITKQTMSHVRLPSEGGSSHAPSPSLPEMMASSSLNEEQETEADDVLYPHAPFLAMSAAHLTLSTSPSASASWSASGALPTWMKEELKGDAIEINVHGSASDDDSVSNTGRDEDSSRHQRGDMAASDSFADNLPAWMAEEMAQAPIPVSTVARQDAQRSAQESEQAQGEAEAQAESGRPPVFSADELRAMSPEELVQLVLQHQAAS